jgi:uncharacterized protein (UPF0303 family)
MQGTGPDDDEWIRRKRNVVDRFRHSSALVQSQIDYLGSNAVERYPVSLPFIKVFATDVLIYLLNIYFVRSMIHVTGSIQGRFLS